MKEQILALPNGARFFRGDLHIHSYGASYDVTDKTCTPDAIVATAKQEGLALIAIADHNDISAVKSALAAAVTAKLMVIPAVELSTSQGHLLCYLPTLQLLEKFFNGLTIKVAGGASYCEQGMLDCLRKLDELGGFGVLAHVDGSKGFATESPGATPHAKDVLFHPALLGIELKSATSDISYTATDPDSVRKRLGVERASQSNIGAHRPLARILNSDAHTLTHLGRNAAGDKKVTRYKMNSPSFESLRQALFDSEVRVRLEDEVPSSVYQVVGLRLAGGFLDNQAVHFSSNLNCIIGGRGTGKSTLLEGIRLLSGDPGEQSDIVDSEVWPEQVDLVVKDQAGQFHTISRAKRGEVESGDNIFGGPSAPFPIDWYRQGATHDISRRAKDDPGVLLEYLDRFVDIDADRREEDRLCEQLRELQKEIDKATLQVELIPSKEAALKSVESQIAHVNAQNGKEVLEIQRTVARERAIRTTIKEQTDSIVGSVTNESLNESIEAIKSAAVVDTLKLGASEFSAISTSAHDFQESLAASEQDVSKAAKALQTKIVEQLESWNKRAALTSKEIDEKKKVLEANGIRVDLAYFQKLATDQAQLEKTIANLRKWEKHRTELIVKRKAVSQKRWEVRERIATTRAAYGTKASHILRHKLTDISVSLKYDRTSYSPEAVAIIADAVGWRTNQVPRATAIVEQLTIPRLLNALESSKPTDLLALKWPDDRSVFSTNEAGGIIEKLSESEVRCKLETCLVLDRPRLTVTRMAKLSSGKEEVRTRDFRYLSFGQQQSVLLALVLSSDSRAPLIIDQPEDDLDSQFIYTSIVPVLRHAKERRQIIVVTHNANVAVLGDAEQIVVLKSSSGKSVIHATGSIDDDATRREACAILEGHRDAFKRRATIYGFNLKDKE